LLGTRAERKRGLDEEKKNEEERNMRKKERKIEKNKFTLAILLLNNKNRM
jgi:hypothetical protein